MSRRARKPFTLPPPETETAHLQGGICEATEGTRTLGLLRGNGMFPDEQSVLQGLQRFPCAVDVRLASRVVRVDAGSSVPVVSRKEDGWSVRFRRSSGAATW